MLEMLVNAVDVLWSSFLFLQLSFKYIKISYMCLMSLHQRSLASYIKRHAYSNAKTEDLWAALEEGSGEPVNKLMNSWTKQKGYPVVSVKVKDQKLEFEQVYLSDYPSYRL